MATSASGREHAAAFFESGRSVGFLSTSPFEICECPVHASSDFADEMGERPLATTPVSRLEKSPMPAKGRERAAAFLRAAVRVGILSTPPVVRKYSVTRPQVRANTRDAAHPTPIS